MASLPYELAAEFPAILTSRSGLDKVAFEVLRAGCGNGQGTKQFVDVMMALHQLRHDEQHVLYNLAILRGLDSRGIGIWGARKFEPFRRFADKEGYAGFVPSSQWVRDMYGKMIESH